MRYSPRPSQHCRFRFSGAVLGLLIALACSTASARVATIREFAVGAAASPETVWRVRGTVTALWTEGAFFLQDETGAVFVHAAERRAEGLQSGDVIEATGGAVLGGITPHLSLQEWERVGRAPLPAPEKADFAKSKTGELDARRVRLRGRVPEGPPLPSNARTLYLSANGATFPVQFEGPEDGRVWPELNAGELVEAVGALSVRGDRDKSPYRMRLLLASRSDVLVAGPPPWWAPPRLYFVLAAAGLLVLGALAWGILLRRRVQEQTRQIQERLQRETALEQRYRALVEGATDVILAHDLDGYITSINPAGERRLGVSAAELAGRPIDSLTVTDGNEHMGRLVMPNGDPSGPGTAAFGLQMRAADGHLIPFEVNSWVEYRDGAPVGVQAICRDVSERVEAEQEKARLEKKLREIQKLESLGVLAGGLAHDFNNLLTAILGNAGLARMEIPEGSRVQGALAEIEQAADRAADLCRQMLAYSGQGRFATSKLDLSQIVRETAGLFSSTVSPDATLTLELEDRLPAVSADATQLRQIVLNLLINAGEALGDQPGQITLATGTMRGDRTWFSDAQIAPDHTDGDFVFLEVKDTGSGMDARTLARIFEPFFTTKFMGRGLGLAAVLGIVRSHGGALKATSTPGEGSTFCLALPAAGPHPHQAEFEFPSRTNRVLAGTVLVVDDEDSVRGAVERVLKSAGCEVFTAVDGVEGVELFERHFDEIDVVLLDLTMPRLNGVGALKEFRRIRPDICVVLMSGFSEAHALARFAGEGLAGFLQKPFTGEKLRDKIRGVLATRQIAVVANV